MMKNTPSNKQPKSSAHLSSSKIPKSHQQDQGKGFVWRFSLVDKEGPFGWKSMSNEKYLDILTRMGNFEGMSLDEIGRGGSHAIPWDGLSKKAQDRLKEIKQDDIEELFSLRMGGKERIFCIRAGRNCLKVLWWDPDHKVCPSSLKHT